MAKIAFILLCHKDAPGVIAQAKRLTAAGDMVAIHFDGNGKREDYAMIRQGLADNPSVVFAAKQHKCGWGAWSLVASTLEAVKAAAVAFPQASHFYLLSGDCMPIKSAEHARDFLDAEDCDYIESFDFFQSDWIKTGFREERLIYRHPFNERTQKKLFYAWYNIQKKLGLTRKIPEDIEVMIGSQWWCLRRETIEKILDFCNNRRDVMRFFSTVWIPDEVFFQTIVRHLIPRNQIKTRTLTFLMFTDYGMPVTFHDDHYDMLLSQDYLFARKISPDAEALKTRLGSLWAAKGRRFSISGNGIEVFRFLVGQGRVGRRFGPRFWEADSSLGRDRTLLMVVSKKWHVAKRLTEGIRNIGKIPAVDYLFNELDAGLPDLGGVETTLAKRERHRRALIRLLMEEFDDERLVICLDTSAIGLINDMMLDKAKTRVLLIDAAFDEDYTRGHMQRIGLTGPDTGEEIAERLSRSVLAELEHETERLRDIPDLHVISREAGADANAAVLAKFLGVDLDTAKEIASVPYLFDD